MSKDARTVEGSTASRRDEALVDNAFGPREPTMTVPEAVAARMRELILTDKLAPGTPLRLRQVAAKMGVSVTPVREAIRILEAERLVSVEPRRGAVVARLNADDIEELYAVRAALESLAARHGCASIGVAGIDAMTTALARMVAAADAGDVATFLAEDRAFHAALYESSGHHRLVAKIAELLESGRRIVYPYVYRSWFPIREAADEHREILAAVLARDVELVERLTRENINRAGARALLAFEEDQL